MAAPVRALDPKEVMGGAPLASIAAEQDTDLVRRMKRMFREEWDKPFWNDLREQVALDFGYYTGSGQWSPEAKRKMAKEEVPALTLNHIRPTCQVLFGLERTSRYEPKAAPEGPEDEPVAEIFTRLIRKVRQETNAEYIETDGFEDGVICGVVAFELPIDYSEDAVQGKIEFATVRVPDELMWATPWYRYDMRDTRAMWRHRWVDVDELAAAYPKHREAIRAALSASLTLDPREEGGRAILSEGDPADPYKSTTDVRPQDDRDFWFDEKNGRVRVLECYFPAYYPVWLLTVDNGRRVIESTSEVRIRRLLAKLVEQDQTRTIKLIERNRRIIEAATILPATDLVLERGIPFEKDADNYPYVLFFAENKRDEIQGVVRSLRDPQDEINSRRSQVAWLVKATGDGWFADDGSLVDIKKFEEESRNPKGVYLVKKSGADPRRVPAPSLPTDLLQLLRYAVNEIREISGVNSSLRGITDEELSGVAMARAMKQGQVTTTGLFDNFRFTKRLLYTKMARRIQEVYTDEQVVRLFNPENNTEEFVTINQTVQEPSGADNPGMNPIVRHRVLNDITTLKADIQMIEVPASPTQRAANLATLLELVQKLPAATPMILDAIVESMDGLPPKVVQRVKRWVAEQMDAPKGPEPPKVSIALRGELDPATSRDLADGALDGPPGPPEAGRGLGGDNGNPQNPSGQIPTGGENLQNRPDLTVR